MAHILLIETSTRVCSVALAINGVSVDVEECDQDGFVHSELLTIQIEALMARQSGGLAGIDAVAVSIGPGSYTGLRIGLSVAKGLCFAGNLPLITIGSLKALAGHYLLHHPNTTAQPCPMIDARRMEVFTQVFDAALNPITDPWAEVVEPNSFASHLSNGSVVFFGDGADKTAPILTHPNAQVVSAFRASATGMAAEAERLHTTHQWADLAYSAPNYLKEFRAG